jgi:hypothetical protein
MESCIHPTGRSLENPGLVNTAFLNNLHIMFLLFGVLVLYSFVGQCQRFRDILSQSSGLK